MIAWLWVTALSGVSCTAHTSTQVSEAEQKCNFSGTFRVNVGQSDRLYSVVKDATSTVTFGDQQQFFMDLSTRLTPPDLLAIDCKGQQVSIGSSRGSRVTYVADGPSVSAELAETGSMLESR